MRKRTREKFIKRLEMNASGAAIEGRQIGKGGNRQSKNANQARQREVSRKRKGAPLKMRVQEEKAEAKATWRGGLTGRKLR